ncbi:MAG: hypothetical protein C0417_02835 [Chlorobiaceae bacterium]|nr:hypothetical protein [Chlorobiaceae bacterium]
MHIVRELSKKRIVMLGDFAHGFPLPYQSLVKTVSTWLTMVEKGESEIMNMALFLEEDKQINNLIKQYIKTGDIDPFLDLVLPNISIERLEFYSDLRNISKRVDTLNNKFPPSKQIVFDIQGPEAMNIFDPKIIDSSERASRLFFVNQRDSLISSNIISYLNEYPSFKAIIFYGAGHLKIKTVRKDYSGVLTPEESKGMFLGGYLKQALGSDQVFTINQVARSRSPLKSEQFGSSDFFINAEDVPWKDSPPNDDNLLPDYYDAFIIRNGFVINHHPLQYIFSNRIIQASLKRLELFESHKNGASGKNLYQIALNTLKFHCDTSFSTTEQWKTWRQRYPFKGLELLRSENYKKQIFEKSSQLIGTKEFLKFIDDLISLGFDPRIGSPTMSREEWQRDLDKMWPQIVFLNAIGVYFVGDSTEKENAKNYLVEASGINYDDPAPYLKLWRKKFYDLNY